MAKITIIEDGPAIIEDEEYLLVQSKVFTDPAFTKKVAICRCGKSQNSVWCDGSHKSKEAEVAPKIHNMNWESNEGTVDWRETQN